MAIKLIRIVYHWTGGGYYPSVYEYYHYPFLIDKNGIVHKGKYTIEDNINCQDGIYAPHTGGGNTAAVGIALCGMAGFNGKDIRTTKFPLTPNQCEKGWELGASVAKIYNPQIEVMTHMEFGLAHPNTSSAGKIDINWLPVKKDGKLVIVTGAQPCGDYIRNKVKWYQSQIGMGARKPII